MKRCLAFAIVALGLLSQGTAFGLSCKLPQLGDAYLVVSPKLIGSFVLSPLCGTTVDLKYAAERGFLATLERVIGGGN